MSPVQNDGMRVALAGKGGVGKTTISSVLARTLARRGHSVIAVDCDSDPHLAMSIGLDPDATGSMLPFLDRGGRADGTGNAPDASPVQLLRRHSVAGPDGVEIMLAARISRPGGG